jgi:ABC-type Fe3+ transport system permease subunit
MFANSIYIVALTAFLMGLRPNKAIFDGAIMTWFWIGTVLPLLALFLLSFTQGDTEFYQNWLSQVQEDGLDAQSVSFDSEQMRQGFWGMLTVSLGLIGASGLLWKLMDRRWGKSAFDN